MMTREEKEIAWERINDQLRDDKMTEEQMAVRIRHLEFIVAKAESSGSCCYCMVCPWCKADGKFHKIRHRKSCPAFDKNGKPK